jgi:hypothetical protein
MSAEAELLCLCAAGPQRTAEFDRLRSLARDRVDWRLFSRLASHHRVFPAAYKALTLAGPGLAPPEVVEDLRALYFRNLTLNMAAEKELVRVLTALGEHGLPALPYKGPVLAETEYGDLGLRQFNDLDILVREADLEGIISVLQGLGFESDIPTDPRLWTRYRSLLRDLAFLRTGGGCPVEIQWRLVQKYHPLFRDRERVWADLREVNLQGFPIRTLSAADTLLILCLHGLYHSWEHLQMVTDVAACLAGPAGFDWPLLIERARTEGGLRILLLGLLLARNLLGTELPEEILKLSARDRFVGGLAARLSAVFFRGSSFSVRARSFFFLEARMIAGASNRARYVWGRLTTPNEEDWRTLRLPPALFVFHPLLRSARLFKKYFARRQ